jgi:hypothetical protein
VVLRGSAARLTSLCAQGRPLPWWWVDPGFCAMPQAAPVALRVAPRLASWIAADHPDQQRLAAYLDYAVALLTRPIDARAGDLATGPASLSTDYRWRTQPTTTTSGTSKIQPTSRAIRCKLTAAGVPTTSARYHGTLHDFMMLNPYVTRSPQPPRSSRRSTSCARRWADSGERSMVCADVSRRHGPSCRRDYRAGAQGRTSPLRTSSP